MIRFATSTMYAVVEIGGKQVTVAPGTVFSINKLDAAADAKSVKSDKVLAIFEPDGSVVEVGMPYLAGKSVEFKVLEADIQDDKVTGAKWKRRKRYLKVFGHRQRTTQLEVTKIG